MFGRRIAMLLAALLAAAVPASAQMKAEDIINRPELTDLSDQDVNADTDLIKALREAALVPAKFEPSVESIDLDTVIKKRVGETFQLRNTGQKDAEILSINTVGNFPGFKLEHDCPDVMGAGEYCSVSISYLSNNPVNLSSAIVFSVNADNQSEVSVPFKISVNTPARRVEVINPKVIVKPRAQTTMRKVKPTSHQIASNYFGSVGGLGRRTPTGISILKGKPATDARTVAFAGTNYGDMKVETVYRDERYDRSIPFADASLRVDRDRILTTDRVIKAILETPVTNIMCGKTVAHVESDVYSATSDVPLIPAGSRVVGKCGNFVNERVGIEWTRIITTDGRSIAFDLPADTRDSMGYGGALGRVVQPAFDRYVLPVVSTLIDSGAGLITAVYGEDTEVVVDENGITSSSTSAANEGVSIITNDARRTAQQIISDIRDTRKIAIIPAGSRIDIEISEDIYFTESRKVVRLADMTFDLDKVERGGAKRDVPRNILLKPAPYGYEGPTVDVNGRAYILEESPAEDDGTGRVAYDVQASNGGGSSGRTEGERAKLTLDGITERGNVKRPDTPSNGGGN